MSLILGFLARWRTVLLVAGGMAALGGLWFNAEKRVARERAACTAASLEQTVQDQAAALEAQKIHYEGVIQSLNERLQRTEEATREAFRREADALRTLAALQEARQEARSDPTYAEWADTRLPAGVVERLRRAAGTGAEGTDLRGSAGTDSRGPGPSAPVPAAGSEPAE